MTKTLGVLRHAKSSWDSPGLADFDRPLNGRGRKAAVRMGAEMKRLDPFDLVIASPARRVTETLELVQEGYGDRLPVRFEPRVYEASLGTLLEIVRSADEQAERLLLAGHNPGCQELAGWIASSDDPLRGSVSSHYPTAALLVTELAIGSWRDVEPGCGRIVEFIKPRELG